MLVSLTVNGTPVSREVDDETLLAVLLREHLGLTGTHVGGDTTQCGSGEYRANLVCVLARRALDHLGEAHSYK
jgi:aerobic-type carbon monoxide dehydrogenase small subunit (CoxS/CutS family)